MNPPEKQTTPKAAAADQASAHPHPDATSPLAEKGQKPPKPSRETRRFSAWFRQAVPYVREHRGATCVLYLPDDLFDQKMPLVHLCQDITAIADLGVRLVLVYGAELHLGQRLAAKGKVLPYVSGQPVCDHKALEQAKEAVVHLRLMIESAFAQGTSPPLSRARLVTGNFLTAKPLGILDGVDHLYTGELRRLDASAIDGLLGRSHIVMLSPLAHSPSGDAFFLPGERLAAEVASQIRSDKLIFFSAQALPRDDQGKLLRQIGPTRAEQLSQSLPSPHKERFALALRACRAGVRRVHLLDIHHDGALLEELFTMDGCGTMITLEHYDSLHDATLDDVAGILTLIHPLEADGLLVPRTQQQLERQVHDFVVMERDGTIIGCAALNEIPVESGAKAAELACMAVHPDYRNDKRGTALLLAIEERAAKRGITRLYALTIRAIHWFQEHGFRLAEPEDLPPARRETYNLQRNSKVLLKNLG